jgi:hypothetical protein
METVSSCSMKNITTLGYWLFLLVVASPRVALADSQRPVIPSPSPAEPQKLTIGEVEDVLLVPWAVTLPARIDTGATLSSLDARNISVRNNVAEFNLGKEHGGSRLQLPVVGWSEITTSVGSEKRPVVEVGICLGPKLIRTVATLRDRSHMTYPFLVGRSLLNGSFMVDTSRSKVVRPACPSDSLAQIQ